MSPNLEIISYLPRALDKRAKNFKKRGEEQMRLWLTVEEAAPYIGDDPQAIYRAIREGDFPWDYVRLGRKIKINARSIGMIPDFWGDSERAPRPRNSEAQTQGESLATAA